MCGKVRQGQGGWDRSQHLFEIRGQSYMYDNEKVSFSYFYPYGYD